MIDQGLLLASTIFTFVVLGVAALLVLGTGVYLSMPWLRDHRPAPIPRAGVLHRTHGGPRVAH